MKDGLKDFINEHRNDFDKREPSEKVWSSIRENLPVKKTETLWSSLWVWRAAAAVFFGLSLYLFVADKPSQNRESTSLQGEFKDLELFYRDQIAEKVAFINDLEGEYDDDQFSQDIQKLDAMYEVLREQMKSSPSVKVKDALILNMLVRIDLLNGQIKKLEEKRKTEDSKSI